MRINILIMVSEAKNNLGYLEKVFRLDYVG